VNTIDKRKVALAQALLNGVLPAAEEFLKRQRRESHPKGTFDKAGRWYPDKENEKRECCDVRSPSRGYPLTLNHHCRVDHGRLAA